ncbi:hypothetical protein [Streptomyces sp. NPDC006446]
MAGGGRTDEHIRIYDVVARAVRQVIPAPPETMDREGTLVVWDAAAVVP